MFWTEKKYKKLKITKEGYHEAWHKAEEQRLEKAAAENPTQPFDFRPCPYKL